MRFHRFGRHLIRVACFILFASTLLHAQGTTNNFTNGSGDGTWENPANWSLGHVPLSTEDVTIGGSLAARIAPSDTSVQSIRSLTMTGTSTLNFQGLELDIAQPSSVASGSTITVQHPTGCPPLTTLVLASTSTLTVSGTLTVEGPCAVLRGAGTVIVKGHFDWIAPSSNLPGPTLGGDPGGTLNVMAGVGTLAITGTKHGLSTYTINNQHTVTWPNGASIQAGNGAVFNNLDGGTVSLLLGTQTFDNSLGGATPQFNNSGTFNSPGTFTFTGVPFTNTVTNGIPGTVGAGGNLVFGGGYTQTAGPTTLTTSVGPSGSISVGAAGFNLNGGILNGTGTITGNVINNGGHVQPGLSPTPGTLTITGNYTQGAGGILDLALAGTTAGNFSVLAISGTATLGGTLNALSFGGFTPPASSSFQVMTFASRTGDFTTNNLTVNGVALTKNFHTGDLTLVVKHRRGQITSQ
ncbi:MAG TPA: hypothetical protein VFN26_09540 [Candidatus Acidoferrum sp.]|nr:hypothetical protein [Candidatus Acidoferrum sp.]